MVSLSDKFRNGAYVFIVIGCHVFRIIVSNCCLFVPAVSPSDGSISANTSPASAAAHDTVDDVTGTARNSASAAATTPLTRHALTSVSSPALSTLDRVFRLEGYDDRPKNRRPVMGTSTNTKNYGESMNVHVRVCVGVDGG